MKAITVMVAANELEGNRNKMSVKWVCEGEYRGDEWAKCATRLIPLFQNKYNIWHLDFQIYRPC